jgi:hypothetical protein
MRKVSTRNYFFDANDVEDDSNDLDVEDLVKLLNNTMLDSPELASTKVDETKELLIVWKQLLHAIRRMV